MSLIELDQQGGGGGTKRGQVLNKVRDLLSKHRREEGTESGHGVGKVGHINQENLPHSG